MKRFYVVIVALLLTCSSFGQLTGIKTIPGSYASIAAAIADLNLRGVGQAESLLFPLISCYPTLDAPEDLQGGFRDDHVIKP